MYTRVSYQFLSSQNESGAFCEGNPQNPGESIQLYYRGEHKLHRRDRRVGINTKSLDLIDAALMVLRFDQIFLEREQVTMSTLKWGEHHPRIWQGSLNLSNPLLNHFPIDPRSTYGQLYTQSVVASSSLYDELRPLFRYIEPSAANLQTYGHRIRELMLLACTEVEACWKGILRANALQDHLNKNYNTNEYVKICQPLRLSEWAVKLADYPELTELAPFSGWTAQQPTKSLSWYQAYNAIKHDREREFGQATLAHALAAVASVFIMQCAQWGPEIYMQWFGERTSPFQIVSFPEWKPDCFYIPSAEDPDHWNPLPHPELG